MAKTPTKAATQCAIDMAQEIQKRLVEVSGTKHGMRSLYLTTSKHVSAYVRLLANGSGQYRYAKLRTHDNAPITGNALVIANIEADETGQGLLGELLNHVLQLKVFCVIEFENVLNPHLQRSLLRRGFVIKQASEFDISPSLVFLTGIEPVALASTTAA